MKVKSEKGKIKIGLIILIIVLVLLIVGGGVFAYLYFKTDMLKSNEELFWKYMGQNIEMTDKLKIQEDERYKNKNYKLTGKIDFDMRQEELDNLNAVKIDIEAQNNAVSNSTYSKINAKLADQELFNLEYLKNNDVYALKNTEIANGYIGIKNEGLRDLAEKLDIGTNEIPDKLDLPECSELLDISKEEKQHIIDTYYNVIKSNVNKKKYTKRKDLTIQVDGTQYAANSYSVTLTQREYQTLRIKVLETLKTDSITLNLMTTKMKSVNKDSQYANINELNQKISELIEQVNQEKVTDDEYITFTVYTNNGKTINTVIEVINKTKISISHIKDQGKIVITQDSEEGKENNWKQITYIYRNDNSQEYFLLDVKFEKELNNIAIEVKKDKNDSGYTMDGKFTINSNVIRYKEELTLSNEEPIPEISQSNNLIINDLEAEKVKVLVEKLKEQLDKVVEDKKNAINPQTEENVKGITEII